MKLLRNPEIRRTLWAYLVLTALAALLGCLLDLRCGLLLLAFGILFTGVYLLSEAPRYRRLEQLACDIDRILHGEVPSLPAERYTEGELCILQNEINKMTLRLREQQQNLLKDKLSLADSLADISHQIRTPLTSITLLAQLLREPELTAERRQSLTRELLSLLSRIDWLITTLLKLSRLDTGTIQFRQEQAPMEELIRKAAEPLQIPMELRCQKLEIQVSGTFQGDLSWTAEALGNILKNCMEHTPAGGTIRITAEENALYRQIVITDSGSGIPREDLPHIFERFYRGSSSGGQSFGIGLALARMIAVNQNGTLKAENVPRGGARFTMRFFKGTI